MTETGRKWTCGLSFLGMLIVGSVLGSEQRTEHRIDIGDYGAVILELPAGWRPRIKWELEKGGAWQYELVPSGEHFSARIQVMDREFPENHGLTDEDLEARIEALMIDEAPQSIEGRVISQRFGEKHDGVYSRLTDKAPAIGEYRYVAKGFRLTENASFIFVLYSNDEDRAVIDDILRIVETATVDPL